MSATKTLEISSSCYHCGEDLPASPYTADQKSFCCLGCKGVYQVLQGHQMGDYYAYNAVPGKRQSGTAQRLDYLDEELIAAGLLDYQDEQMAIVTFYIPAIHCSSCIWLLENLYKFHSGIRQSRTDFLKKQVCITYKKAELSLRQLAELLVRIGYEPLISLQDVVKKQQNPSSQDKTLLTKIAVAGFCFGNSMLLSFPDGRDYFSSAWHNLKNGILNLDFPLALGIAVMFGRSAAEILSHTGAGFVDTLCGLVFFLLIGRWMQQHTYHHLSFERDYRSYFPVAVTCINAEGEKAIPLESLKKGDRILIRNNEIIPADAILLKGRATLDFSFVTGESRPVEKVLGEVVYAGGRQLEGAIELEVVKPVSQSYLTRLWNNESFKHSKNHIKTFSAVASKYFSLMLLLLAFSTALFWIFKGDVSRAMASFTAVLIIACPCALALSSPFTLAAVLSIFDRNKFYLKSTAVIEELARIDTFIFDKTGTISHPESAGLVFSGTMSTEQAQLINDLARNSGHPLSRELVRWAGLPAKYLVSHYQEKVGRGIRGTLNGQQVQLGSASFLGLAPLSFPQGSQVHVLIDGLHLGYFLSSQRWRPGFKELASKLGRSAMLHLLSGDQDHDLKELLPFFPSLQHLHFKQSPQDKLDYVSALQKKGAKVLMFGDGLNDAGALKQSDLGVAVTDNINNFSPGCDAILDGSSFSKIPQFIRQAKDAVKVIHMSFGISLLYNMLGLFFAVQGLLSPLIAAILMPLSTVTIILFTSISARLYAPAFFWAFKTGQHEDTYTPSVRILFEEELSTAEEKKSDQDQF
eukprot:gene17849-21328_t